VLPLANTDIDGQVRAEPWDIGADQNPAPMPGVDAYGIPDAWKIQYFGSTNAVNGGALDDWDQDGMNNQDEFSAGTVPTNALSVLKLTDVGMLSSGTNFVVRWQSVSGKYYRIQKSTNLVNGFSIPLLTGIPGTGGINSRTVTVGQAAEYFRVKVE
ncbi:MAG: hypothetical protein C0404_13925, partial [Verrucomicrobia bacterium]|nr:hypothetical protein [Verrucomicrobiota bacterium]